MRGKYYLLLSIVVFFFFSNLSVTADGNEKHKEEAMGQNLAAVQWGRSN